MSPKKYLYWYAALVIVLSGLLATFNMLVDPYSLFGSERISGFNEKKPTSINRTKLYKSYEVMRVTPNSLIVGNSRPEMGLAPQSSCWKSEHGTVYSLTFPGLSAYEQIRALFHGVSSSNVSHILLGVDFYDVLYRRRNNDNPFAWPHKSSEFLDRLVVDENLKENDRFWRTQLNDSFMALFSLNAVIDSLYTIALQAPNSPDRTRLGFNPARDYQEVIQHEGAWVLFDQKLSELKSHFSKTGMSIYTPPYRWSIELEALKRTIKLVQKHNIHLIIFINPYHYSYLESIREAGYWDEFEEFKRSLTILVSEFGNANIELWDFSLYSKYTVTPIPKKGEDIRLRWFWEPAHYTAQLGDIMLEEFFGKDCVSNKLPVPLGVRLDNIVIEKHLNNQEKQRELLLHNGKLAMNKVM